MGIEAGNIVNDLVNSCLIDAEDPHANPSLLIISLKDYSMYTCIYVAIATGAHNTS